MDTLTIVLLIYVIINVVVFLMYLADKLRAKTGAWRISENTLLIGALIGPFGATLGMLLGHHKTNKPKFKLVYMFLILHIAAIIVLIPING